MNILIHYGRWDGWRRGYKKIGRIHDSLILRDKVVDASKRVLGEEHPDTINCVKILESLYQEIRQGACILRIFAELKLENETKVEIDLHFIIL